MELDRLKQRLEGLEDTTLRRFNWRAVFYESSKHGSEGGQGYSIFFYGITCPTLLKNIEVSHIDPNSETNVRRQGIDVDIKKVATQLEALASDLREAGQEKTK